MKKILINISWIVLAISIITYSTIGGWSDMKKDTDNFSIKIVCKKCGSENCSIDGFGTMYDSGAYLLCEDCNKFEEVSNYGN